MGRGRIGMDHFGIPLTLYEKIGSFVPEAKLQPASSFFRYVRMIKTAAEIQRLRESAALNEQAINTMLRAAKPGVKESELAGIYKGEVARGRRAGILDAYGRQPRWQLSRHQR